MGRRPDTPDGSRQHVGQDRALCGCGGPPSPHGGLRPPTQPLGPASTASKKAQEKRATLSQGPGPGASHLQTPAALRRPAGQAPRGRGAADTGVAPGQPAPRPLPAVLTLVWALGAGHVSMKRRPLAGPRKDSDVTRRETGTERVTVTTTRKGSVPRARAARRLKSWTLLHGTSTWHRGLWAATGWGTAEGGTPRFRIICKTKRLLPDP